MRLGRAFIVSFFLFYSAVVVAAFSPPVIARDGMVVTDHYLASQVGARILRQGGNAMDAAVAIGYALAVVHPCCGNIGGGGFMLVHWHTGQDIVLDFRETAPAAIRAKLFFDEKGHLKSDADLGYLFVGVPGTVMGLNEGLRKFGTLTLPEVMAPAIALAEQGFVLNRYDVRNFLKVEKDILTQPNLIPIFQPQGHWLRPGERMVQADLAKTLRIVSREGSDVFYHGAIAKAIVTASTKDHGVLSLEDFSNYRVYWRSPIHCDYQGYRLLTAPPPSSGVTVCEILSLVNSFPLKQFGFHSAQSVHYNVAAMKQAFYDRNHYLGDPHFVKNPVSWLLSPARLQKIQHFIAVNKVRHSLHLHAFNKSMHTTHYVVMDKEKNVVSTTYTINSFFGSVRVAENTGFFLNNDLKDFALKKNEPNLFFLVHGSANLIGPNKRPLSSMSPTLVMRGHAVFMALGAAGGPTIITSLVQAIENVIDFGMDVRAANDSPRYHMQWLPNIIYWEPFAFSLDTLRLLRERGYNLQQNLFGRYHYWGQIASLLVEPSGVINGASDNRHPNGRAVGVVQVSRVKSKSNSFASLE